LYKALLEKLHFKYKFLLLLKSPLDFQDLATAFSIREANIRALPVRGSAVQIPFA
jgi:hypothetical protein